MGGSMAVLEIHKAGDPVLKKFWEPVKRIDKKVKRILKDMAETLYKNKNGIGRDAPQVGILQRIVVIDLQDGNGLLELINPVITKKEGSQVVGEGCLSVPNFEGEVERAVYVECEYTDASGKKQFIATEGLLAICLQHETDHLDGILFTDKAGTITLKAPED